MNNDKQLPALYALSQLMGGNYRVMIKTSGTEAVDTAIKAARRFWWARHGKHPEAARQSGPYIIVARNSFHGRALGATSLFPFGDSSRKGFAPFANGTLWVPYNNISAIETHFRRSSKIAGILLEPIQGEGGIIIPDDDYLLQVKALCQKHGALFMLDEIQTGFGRTGANFAFEHYGAAPDILLSAKALGGGAMPVSAIMGRKNVVFDDDAAKEYDVLSYLAEDGAGEEGSTWSGSAMLNMAILYAIKELCDDNLAEIAKQNGKQFIAELKGLQKKYPKLITDVRGTGLMIGVDVAVHGRTLSHALLKEGVWAYYTGKSVKTIRFLPPLATPPFVLSRIVHCLELALARCK